MSDRPTRQSEIVAAHGEPWTVLLNPKPLHPRPIEGNIIRVRPPIVLRDAEMVKLMIALANPNYMRDLIS